MKKVGITPQIAAEIRRKRGLGNGTKLYRLRLKRGMSRSDLSNRSGVPLRTIEKFEQAHSPIEGTKLNTLCNLSKALDCKIPEIIDDEELIERFNEVK